MEDCVRNRRVSERANGYDKVRVSRERPGDDVHAPSLLGPRTPGRSVCRLGALMRAGEGHCDGRRAVSPVCLPDAGARPGKDGEMRGSGLGTEVLFMTGETTERRGLSLS